MFLGAEQGREDRARVDAGQAQPVDRPVPADQRGGLGVPDDRMILDGQGHGAFLGFPDFHQAEWRRSGSAGRIDPRRPRRFLPWVGVATDQRTTVTGHFA